VVACLLSLSGGWLLLRGWQARGHLVTATGLARDLSQQVLAGDTAQARRTLGALQEQTAAAHDATTGPAWWAGTVTPYAGGNVTAVRGVAETIDALARRAFPALLSLKVSALRPTAGQLDLVALRDAAPAAVAADTAVQEIRARFDAVPGTGLWPPIRTAVDQLRAEIWRLSAMVAAARRAALLLPTLLGADGARTYLVAFQNLAETRSTGGIFGAYAVIRAEHGRIAMIAQGPAAGLTVFDRPVLPLDGDTAALYTDRIGIYPADVNLTPDFPTAAALFREMYRRRTGTTVDGVLATDPVALSYLLRAVGPVSMPAAPILDAASAVRTLLSQPYQLIRSETARNSYFAASVRAVLDAVLHRPVNPRVLLAALDQAVAERRVLFWSARPEEQQALVGTQLAGVLPQRETVPTVGVFLNDGSGAKLDYYLTRSATLTVGKCRPDGRRELHLLLTLGSSAPNSGLTPAVLGMGLAGDPYTARTLVYVFSPARGSLLQARLDGAPAPMGSGTERGRQVAVISLDVAPGRSRILEISLLTPAATSTGAAELRLTPGVTPWTTRINSAQACEQ
jgi:DNA-binding NarL/FixJ family response regulator